MGVFTPPSNHALFFFDLLNDNDYHYHLAPFCASGKVQ